MRGKNVERPTGARRISTFSTAYGGQRRAPPPAAARNSTFSHPRETGPLPHPPLNARSSSRRDAADRPSRRLEQLLRVPARRDVRVVGAEHPHELADDLAARRAAVTVVRAGSADVSLTIVKWRSASDAICGRWVMQMTWRPAGERAQLLADRARGLAADARRRPRRTRASPGPPRRPTLISASITRESSPPEAMSRSGPAGTPGFGAIRNSTSSRAGRARARRARSSATSKRRALHRQLGERARAPPPARPRRAAARAARSAAARSASSARDGRRAPRSPPRSPPRRRRARRAAPRHASACASTAAIVPPCLRLSRSNSARRSSTSSSRPGGRVDAPRRSGAARPPGRRPRPRAPPARSASASSAASTPRDRLQRARGAGQRRGGAAVARVSRRERLGRARRRGAQRLEVAQPLALGAQLGLLGLARRGRLDLRELELEQVELALARAGALAQLLELGSRSARSRAYAAGERRAPPACAGAAEAVEDLELRDGERELAVLVLAVERRAAAPPMSRRSAAVALRPFT